MLAGEGLIEVATDALGVDGTRHCECQSRGDAEIERPFRYSFAVFDTIRRSLTDQSSCTRLAKACVMIRDMRLQTENWGHEFVEAWLA